MLNIFGSKGEDNIENNHLLFEGGGGITKYIYKFNDRTYLFAIEPRIDFSYITNGSVSIIPNFVIHSSYRYRFIEPRLTLRGGFSLLIARGGKVNVSEEVYDNQIYTEGY